MSTVDVKCEDGVMGITLELLEFVAMKWPHSWFALQRSKTGEYPQTLKPKLGVRLFTMVQFGKTVTFFQMHHDGNDDIQLAEYRYNELAFLESHYQRLGINPPTREKALEWQLKKRFDIEIGKIFEVSSICRAKRIKVYPNGTIMLYSNRDPKKVWYIKMKYSSSPEEESPAFCAFLAVITGDKVEKKYKKPFMENTIFTFKVTDKLSVQEKWNIFVSQFKRSILRESLVKLGFSEITYDQDHHYTFKRPEPEVTKVKKVEYIGEPSIESEGPSGSYSPHPNFYQVYEKS